MKTDAPTTPGHLRWGTAVPRMPLPTLGVW